MKACSGINPVDEVWNTISQAPSKPMGLAKPHPIHYSGRKASDKIKEIHQFLQKKNLAAFVFPALDEVAWLCNFRGCDVAFNPVTISYLVVTQNGAHLFIDKQKVTILFTIHFFFFTNEPRFHQNLLIIY